MVDVSLGKKKKIIIISIIVFVAYIVIGSLYSQSSTISEQISETDNQFMQSDNLEVIREKVENGTYKVSETTTQFLSSDEIKEVIREKVDSGTYQSLFVGIIDENNVDYYYYGDTAKNGNPVDENTIFEIGSVTKIFTTLLLADMVEKGEINLNDPIDKFLPDIKTPSKNGKKITILDLATHTSGLSKTPDDFSFVDLDAQHKYDREEMYNYLSNFDLSREIGSQFEYSNIGIALIGVILSIQTDQSYEEMLKERIFDKFGMDSACLEQCDKLRDRFAKPHIFGNQTNMLNLSDDMAGTGGIKSSGKDMLTFLEYAMGLRDSDLKNSFELAQTVHYQIDNNVSIGLGWIIEQHDERVVILHNGRTAGFASFVGFDPESNQGVVVLSNTSLPPYDIGIWVLGSL